MAREKVLCGKEEIIRAAVRIVESEGMEALSARPTVTQPDPDAEKGFISFFEKKTGEE